MEFFKHDGKRIEDENDEEDDDDVPTGCVPAA
jgi:hypothetical protein